MTSKSLLKSILVIVLITMSPNLKAQSDDVFILNQTLLNLELNDTNHFYHGSVHLKNNEILEGKISLNQKRDGQYSAILRTDDDCLTFPNNEIEYVELYGNNNSLDQSTYFVPLKDKKRLYRELYVKDSQNAIYDSMKKPFDGKVMNDVYVLENNSLVSTYNFWHSGPKADLLNYFTDRDQKKYKRRDYRNLETLFAQL